jgi:molecular chaperone HscA
MTSLLNIYEPGQTPNPHDFDGCGVIGIDLGTTHSVVAYVSKGKAQIIQLDGEDVLIPSVVSYEKSFPLVGKKAKDLMGLNPKSVIASSKRFMGNGDKKFLIDGQKHTAEKISKDILMYLKEGAEKQLKKPVKKCVITVPAYFSETARSQTRRAARDAGFDVLRLLSEPTAAALAYGLDQQEEGLYVIYDLGGGTFDITVLHLQKGIFQVLATGGDTMLGGDDIDYKIAKYLMPSFETLSNTVQQIVLKRSRFIKEFLSNNPSKDFEEEGVFLPQKQFNALVSPLVEKTIKLCKKALLDAEIQDLSTIKDIVLVGGSTRLPQVQHSLKELFGKEPLCSLNPDEVVAEGAALQAEALVNGSSHLILDVTPLSLGMETLGGLVEKIIPRNTAIPCSIAQEFTTSQDNQTGLVIHVLQGEREYVDHCLSLGKFELKGIPPRPAGMARIRVTFSLDADGILTVDAYEKSQGVQQTIEIKPFDHLTNEKTVNILKESFEHAAEDLEERSLKSAQIEAQQILYLVKNALQKNKDLLSLEELKKIQDSYESLENISSTKHLKEIIEKTHQLKKETQEFAERRISSAIQKSLKDEDISTF